MAVAPGPVSNVDGWERNCDQVGADMPFGRGDWEKWAPNVQPSDA